MTRSRPVDTAPIRARIDELRAALIRLDRDAVQSGCMEVEELFEDLVKTGATISIGEGAELRAGIERVQRLLDNARRMYAGWSRAVALQGPAYTRGGTEPPLLSTRSVAIEG